MRGHEERLNGCGDDKVKVLMEWRVDLTVHVAIGGGAGDRNRREGG